MRSWKKQLKYEFDKTVPMLKEEIKNMPIAVENRSEGREKRSGNALFGRGMIISTACVAMLAIIFTVLGVLGVFKPTISPTQSRYVYTLEINPSVAFVTDENGVVQDVRSLNEDADVVLFDDSLLQSIQNSRLSDAVALYVDTASKLGYLDLANETAVRLTTTTDSDQELFAEISNGLSNYFKTKGIFAVVVENSVSVDELRDILGVSATDRESLADALDKLSVKVGERISENVDEETLKELYDNYIINLQTFELIRSDLIENVERIESSIRALKDIGVLSLKILTHKDNPFPISADYWTIKKYGKNDYTEEFTALMNEMDELIAEYKSNNGIEIASLDEVKEIIETYQSFDKDDFTFDEFKNSLPKYVAILKNIGIDVSALEKIVEVPTTYEEYSTQFSAVMQELYDSRTAKNADEYSRPRKEITQNEYDDFVARIITEYGSLENFWNKK